VRNRGERVLLSTAVEIPLEEESELSAGDGAIPHRSESELRASYGVESKYRRLRG